MANKHKSPIKRAKQDAKRQTRNHAYKSGIATATKNLREAAATGDKEKTAAELKKTQSLVDAAATKGILHRNTVARKVSRLTRIATAK
ncbi:MAG: 30S ribosomal protein S20 [Nitrospinota bacterium]